MKKELIEEIRRIHEITYNQRMLNEGFIDNLLNKAKDTLGLKKVDDPKKADMVSNSPEDIFSTLENTINTGGLSQQKMGKMIYQKSVETLQILLQLLGYSLPVYGVDGLYGPETARAVEKFKKDNGLDVKMKGATPEMLQVLMNRSKEQSINPKDIQRFTDPVIPDDQGIEKGSDDVKYAMDFLIRNGGYTTEQAAGIVGNLQVESGLDTSAIGDRHLPTQSYGIAQWREKRLSNLIRFAKKNNKEIDDLDVQLWFLIHELKTTFRKVDRMIRSSDNVSYIAQIVQAKYEISTPDSLAERQKYANKFYNQYNTGDTQQYA